MPDNDPGPCLNRFSHAVTRSTTAPQEKQSEVLADYFCFVGIRYGTTRSELLQLYGQPQREQEYGSSVSLFYFGDAIYFSIDIPTQRVQAIYLKNPYAVLGSGRSAVRDPKSDLIGKHVVNVFALYGPADRSHASHFDYAISDQLRRGNVTFFCPDFQNGQCSQISVLWFYHDSEAKVPPNKALQLTAPCPGAIESW